MQRRGSILTTAIVLTGVFLTMIVGTMTIYESSNRRANSEKWRDIAEQAARSGLDLVLGWGQASIDSNSNLPTVWEMNDGDVQDPVMAYLNTRGAAPTFRSNMAQAQAGEVLGATNNNVGEYVLSRIGDKLVTIKARIQQYRISPEMPRQYRIGVIARVRKAWGTMDANNDERGGSGNLIAERMVLANVGKDPFSRYAALIDIDFVQNWVPGEIVDGPVHINRGYVDDPAADNPINGARPSNANLRSLMMIHSNNSPKGFSAVNGRNFPQFTETVSMSAFTDARLNDFSPANHTRYLQYDEGPYTGQNSISIFSAPDNAQGLGSLAGPMLLPQNVNMPRSSRSQLSYALGMPPGRRINDAISYGWFNRLQDGLYIPTGRTWGSGASANAANEFTPTTWNYQTGSSADAPAGGIYIRGNVEVMRMSVNNDISFYYFQLGYGNFGLGGAPSRTYVVAANRTSGQIDLYAGRRNVTLDQLYAGGDGGFAAMLATPVTAGANARLFNITAVPPAGNFVHARLEPSLPFPFNGVVFVDLSVHDPARNTGDPTVLAAAATPLTGNIYALGDPGTPPRNVTNKRSLNGSPHERVATYRGNNPAAQASKLTILTAGNVFIQNNILLEAIRLTPAAVDNLGRQGFGPTQDNFQLANSRDLLGIVSDKQVVVGVCAPSTGTRQNVGTVVHAAIAALGDPALQYTNPPRVDAAEMVKPLNMRGSFTTEALMTAFPNPRPEQYNMLTAGRTLAEIGYGGGVPFVFPNTAASRFPVADGTGQGQFPGTPLAAFMQFNGSTQNPNFTSTRGRLLVFGSVTQKKRGILGVGNRSFDKDIRYDKRLLSIAPPLFPTSTNIVVRTSRPFSPNAQLYRPAAKPAAVPADDQSFMAYP